ncbi:hypothetical protein pb186bvf_021209 [Paramecium bursaria]
MIYYQYLKVYKTRQIVKLVNQKKNYIPNIIKYLRYIRVQLMMYILQYYIKWSRV